MDAWCCKCKKKTAIKGASSGKLSNGRPVIRGTCGGCGSKVVRFVSTKTQSADS